MNANRFPAIACIGAALLVNAAAAAPTQTLANTKRTCMADDPEANSIQLIYLPTKAVEHAYNGTRDDAELRLKNCQADARKRDTGGVAPGKF